MGRLKSMVAGLGVGAALMYLYDPQRGRRRRSITRDKMMHSARTAAHGVDVGWRDLGNRVRGTIADARMRLHTDGLSDEVLEARVRSRIGRVVSHPRALDVHSSAGVVRLRGPVLADEVDGLIRTVSSVPGVQEVTHQLDVHEDADIPSLQGGRARPGYPSAFAREHWKPATRLLAGAAGTLLSMYSMRQRGVLGAAAMVSGGALLARSMVNEPIRKLLGAESDSGLISVQKSMHVDAPVDAVFSFWDKVENFPLFMRNVHEVVDRRNGRSHWTVAGPAGTEVQWEAEVVDRVENEVLSWRTVDGSIVRHRGMIRFSEAPEGGTRVDLKMTYTPPGGALGHVVATIFGADPKHELDGDLARMKTLLETGKIPHDAARREGSERLMDELPHVSGDGV